MKTQFLIDKKSLTDVFDNYCEDVRNNRAPKIPYRDFRWMSEFLGKIRTIQTWQVVVTEVENKLVFFECGGFETCDLDLPERLVQDIRDNISFDGEDEDEQKENEDMNMNVMPKFDFGPVNTENVRVSPFGLAIQNLEGNWVSYNAADGTVIAVDGLTFNMSQMLFKMPVALKDIKPGDMVIHNRVPMYVTSVEAGGKQVAVVDIRQGEARTVMPTTNMFGFNFVTKVMSLINLPAANPSPDNPFGNIMPFLLMSSMLGGDSDMGKMFGGEGNDFFKYMMMGQLMGGNMGNIFGNLFAAPAPAAPQTAPVVEPITIPAPYYPPTTGQPSWVAPPEITCSTDGGVK